RDATRTGMRTVMRIPPALIAPLAPLGRGEKERSLVLFLLQFVEHGFELLDRVAELTHLAFELADALVANVDRGRRLGVSAAGLGGDGPERLALGVGQADSVDLVPAGHLGRLDVDLDAVGFEIALERQLRDANVLAG